MKNVIILLICISLLFISGTARSNEKSLDISIHEKAGLSFNSVLKGILRQDPDIIMIGEIRDIETAQIAIRASLTGHLVLATLHTNSAIDSIIRLQDMGIPSYLISASLICVVSQRLFPSKTDRRIGVFELLQITDNVQDAIKLNDRKQLSLVAERNGLKTINEQLVEKVNHGVISESSISQL